MIARVSLDDVVIYANGPLAGYLGTPKSKLVSSSLSDVALLCTGEVSSCFVRPETGRTSNRLVTDGEGIVFEAQLYSDGGVLDIVLDPVATQDLAQSPLADLSAERPSNRLARKSFAAFATLNGDTSLLPTRSFRLGPAVRTASLQWR